MRIHSAPAVALVFSLLALSAHAQQKQPIERADQLPVHTYAVAAAPSALLNDSAGLARLLEALRADMESDLAAYDIRDAATLRGYYGDLATIALLQHRPDDALAYTEKARGLQEKPEARLMSGLILRPLVAAEKAGAGAAARAFSTALAEELRRLPYDSVQGALRARKTFMETMSRGAGEGAVLSAIDPAARNGRLSRDMAMSLVGIAYSLQRVLPHRDEVVRQLSELIAAHRVDKPDIWAAREVSLEGRAGLTPVVVAISDVGVDPDVFPGRMWTNAGEIPGNGADDDGNGWVDDVHGNAWRMLEDGPAITGDLRAIRVPAEDLEAAKQNAKGSSDLRAGLDSPEAQEYKRRLANMSPEQHKPFSEATLFYGEYAHGTHVAGIAARGNPAIRLLNARFEPPYQLPYPAPTAAVIASFARDLQRTVDYYRKAGVRVVNMSWGLTVGTLEEPLEQNGVGASQEERRRLAQEYFDTLKNAFGAAIAGAPEILFVSNAGNRDEDNRFNEYIPGWFDFPNTITVGAVDKAGDETTFTSYGKVDLYANGSEVESFVPGGDTQRWSGTSMAAPQVANLAAKLLAVHPTLSATAVKRLIIDGADPKAVSAGRSIRLLNAKRSFELAETRRQ